MHGDADRETQNRKQMIDPALNFNTKFRNNCWFWMTSAFLKCGISSNNPVQKVEIILLITKRVGASALNTLLQTFSRSWEPGLPISLFSAGPRAYLRLWDPAGKPRKILDCIFRNCFSGKRSSLLLLAIVLPPQNSKERELFGQCWITQNAYTAEQKPTWLLLESLVRIII